MTDHPGVERVLKTLKSSIRLAGTTNRAVEQELELSGGYLSRLLNGPIELKVEHVFEITQALGLYPMELFYLALGDIPYPPSEAMQRITAYMPNFHHPREPKPDKPFVLDTDLLKKRIADAVAAAVREALGLDAAQGEASKKPV